MTPLPPRSAVLRKPRNGVLSTLQNRSREQKRNIENKFEKLIHISKLFWIGLILILILFGLYFLIFQTPTFQVRTIQTNIDNLKFAPREELLADINAYNSKNIFLVFPSNVEKDLLTKFPEITAVKVDKKLPDTLTIEFTETNFVYDIVSLKNSYLINQSGIVIKQSALSIIPPISPTEIKVLTRDFDINGITLSVEEIDSLSKNGKSQTIDEKIRAFRQSKYQSMLIDSYNSIFDKFKKVTVQNNSLPVIYYLNSKDKTVLSEIFPKSGSKLLSYKTMLGYSRFTAPLLLQLDNNYFVIQDSGKYYIFDSETPTDTQIVRLETVLTQLKKDKIDFSIIDVTSEKVSVI